MTGKIYIITNLINKKVYIGQTVRPLKARLSDHISKAIHSEGFTNIFHNAIKKYGEENFEIELLETNVPLEKLNEVEERYIRIFNAVENGYNMKYSQEDPRYNTLIFLSKEELEELYINQKMSTLKIAKMFGVVNTTVGNRLKALGIKARQPGQTSPISFLSKEDLIDLYVKKNLTATAIADMYGVSNSNVMNMIRKYNITKKMI